MYLQVVINVPRETLLHEYIHSFIWNMARHNEIGKMGEAIAVYWLNKNGLEVINRNFTKKYGEIDIVARETSGRLHFIEVKTVSYETKHMLLESVSHETWRPEEKVHTEKQRKLKNVIQVWLSHKSLQVDWQIDILVVKVVPCEKYSQVRLIRNVIFE